MTTRKLERALAAATLFVVACGSHDATSATLQSLHIDTPAASGSRSPSMMAGADGHVRLTWIEPAGEGGVALCTARWEGERWGAAHEVARGTDWFVNWADVPALAASADGTELASFLRKTGGETYDYEVRIARGEHGAFGEPTTLHEDRGPGEHGFVSLVALDPSGFAAVWLDGRNTAGHGEGAMQLMARRVARDGALGPEITLDSRVCDCCPTSAAVLGDGTLLVAYRDRSEDEVRDIGVVALRGESASQPVIVAPDGWRIAGCPVNGPTIVVRGERVAVAWFTLGASGEPRVYVAWSEDACRSFDTPILVSEGECDGLVDAAFDAGGTVWVSWLGRNPSGRAVWKIRSVTPDRRLSSTWTGPETLAGRAAGRAQLESTGAALVLAWVGSGDDPGVRTATLRPGN